MSSVSNKIPFFSIGMLVLCFVGTTNDAFAKKKNAPVLTVAASFQQSQDIIQALNKAKPHQEMMVRDTQSPPQFFAYSGASATVASVGLQIISQLAASESMRNNKAQLQPNARRQLLQRRAYNEALQQKRLQLARTQAKQRELLRNQAVLAQRQSHNQQQAQVASANKRADRLSEQVINNAKAQLGKSYVYGGDSPAKGFDCSGLVQYTFKQGADVRLPRTAAQQYAAAVKVPSSQAHRGDLVFFNTSGRRVSHVGIYLGNNRFIHSPRSGKRIQRSDISGYWKKRLVGFGRIPGACQIPAAYG